MCQEIQETVFRYSNRFLAELSRHNYVTPTSYLELLGIFSKLVGMKKTELNTNRKRLKTGLDKVLLIVHSGQDQGHFWYQCNNFSSLD